MIFCVNLLPLEKEQEIEQRRKEREEELAKQRESEPKQPERDASGRRILHLRRHQDRPNESREEPKEEAPKKREPREPRPMVGVIFCLILT